MHHLCRLVNCIVLFSSQASTYVSSRFPEYWDNPEDFNPYRFDDEELIKRFKDMPRGNVVPRVSILHSRGREEERSGERGWRCGLS